MTISLKKESEETIKTVTVAKGLKLLDVVTPEIKEFLSSKFKNHDIRASKLEFVLLPRKNTKDIIITLSLFHRGEPDFNKSIVLIETNPHDVIKKLIDDKDG